MHCVLFARQQQPTGDEDDDDDDYVVCNLNGRVIKTSAERSGKDRICREEFKRMLWWGYKICVLRALI